MKKILILFLLCFFGFSAFSQVVTKTRIILENSKPYYSYDEWRNSFYDQYGITYPKPKIDSVAFRNILKKNVEYPELARKYANKYKVILSTDFGKDGKIGKVVIGSLPNPMFDSAAIRLLMKTNGYWAPAWSSVGKPIESNVAIPIEFGIRLNWDDSKIVFFASPFMFYPDLVVDSTNTFPAILRVKLTDTSILNQYRKICCAGIENNKSTSLEDLQVKSDSALDGGITQNRYRDSTSDLQLFRYKENIFEVDSLIKEDKYGTVTLGMDIDTFGIASDIHVVNSVDSILDAHAIKQIANPNSIWIPARKDGIKRPSYQEVDFMYRSKIGKNSKITSYEKYTDVAEYKLAVNYFLQKKYEKAIPHFDKACKYYIRNPEAFYYRSLCYFNLNNNDKGCTDLRLAFDLAEINGYPIIMERQKVIDFFNNNCPQE